MNILFTCAGRRTYLLKYFKEQLGCEGQIIGADMQLSAPALSEADIKIAVPGVYDDRYVNTLLDICKNFHVQAIISLNDLELPILAAQKHRFLEIGALPIVASKDVIEICFDKYKTYEFLKKIGLNTPKTFITLQDAIKAIHSNELFFPLILKPRWGSGSIGIEIVENEMELVETYNSLLKKVKKSILGTASKGTDYILIQEKINGQEYGMDVMNDLEGRTRGVSVKRKLSMRAGETDKAETVNCPEIKDIGKKLGKELRHIGNLDVDVFQSGDSFYVLELNPRFGGGFPFSYEAGVNFPKAIIEWLKGNEVDNSILEPRYGEAFAKCDYLVKVN